MPSTAHADPSPLPPAKEHERELAARGHIPLDPESAARSAHNIALWRSYLPTACVQAMIRMGWDYTT